MMYGDPVQRPDDIVRLVDGALRYDGWSARTHQNLVLRVRDGDDRCILKLPSDPSLETLAKHEQRWMHALSYRGIPGIPRVRKIDDFAPTDVGDAVLSTGMLREYIDGEEFHARRRTDAQYGALIEMGHMMYGAGLLLPDDFDGRQIIVDGKGRPYLIDLEEAQEVVDQSQRWRIGEKIEFLRKMNVRADRERTLGGSRYAFVRSNARRITRVAEAFGL